MNHHPNMSEDGSQPKITPLLVGGRKHDAPRSEASQTENNSVAEGGGFKEPVRCVMPLRATVTQPIEKHSEEKGELKVKLAMAGGLALTTDSSHK